MRALLFIAVLGILIGGGVWVAAEAGRSERLPAVAEARGAAAEPRRDVRERRAERRARRAARRRRASPLPSATCPAGLAGCRSVSGQVLYTESVDPDGDGDLHVVLAARDGLSGPGLTAVDVAPELRPRRDPRIGDRVSAAGELQPGSYGQSQVHALEFHVRRN